jgi:hypothetical protein
MKSENKLTYVILILIVINIVYYKIAKTIQKENMKLINNKNDIKKYTDNNQISPILNSEEYLNKKGDDIFETVKDAIELLDCNIVFNNISDSVTNSNTNNLQKKDTNDLISGIGKNINDDIKPIPFPAGNLMAIDKKEKDNESQAIMNHDDDNMESFSSHLKSFLIILAIISLISIFLVAYQECTSKNREFFNINRSGNSDEYHLLKD